MEIKVTQDETRTGRLTPEHLRDAGRAVREDGFVVLADVVNLDHLAVLRERMLEDVAKYVARPDAPFNFNAGNVQQEPPPFAPYLFRDVLFNEPAIAVTHALLGDGLKNAFYSGNTALPGGTRQPVHADVGQLWPDLDVATPPFGVVVNVPVVDMTPENGSTEIWPGTHRDTTVFIQHGDIKVPQDKLEARRADVPPLQPVVRAGSVVIRDLRLWHAGMPNHTDQPRPMIAMIHWVSWWGDGEPLVFPKSEEAFFHHPVLRTIARFTDEPIDYIRHGTAYDFHLAAEVAHS
ncbi:MAG: phytanoyl-CoA dioxygenase family protein [Armatimonadetes bacterium]|nr:phytanoyl-CoA dioxygenase family protein [Armatimonadota bacterium]